MLAVLALRTADRRDRSGAAPPALADRVDLILPQTQCRACGFDGCRPYAEAIARGAVGIDRCPPGGTRTIALLAELLGRDPVPPAVDLPAVPASVAYIDPQRCIGCVKCVRVCPVDAIVGAAGQMHTVIGDHCTGCGLCLPPCPVDCIVLLAPARAPWSWPLPDGRATA